MSMLSFRLFADEHTIGALNLYSPERAVFDGESIAVGAILAAHAAVALTGSQADQNFDAGLASRDLIGQAKGILMNSKHLSADEAFDAIRSASSRLNRKVADIADEIAHTGQLPAG